MEEGIIIRGSQDLDAQKSEGQYLDASGWNPASLIVPQTREEMVQYKGCFDRLAPFKACWGKLKFRSAVSGAGLTYTYFERIRRWLLKKTKKVHG